MKIIGVTSYNFTAILIHIGMVLWQLIHLRFPKIYPNHWVVEINGVFYEAISPRVVRWSESESESYHAKYVKKREVVKEYSLNEVERLNVTNWLNNQIGKKYEYTNFLFHFLKIILFGLWLGDKSFKRHSCVELVEGAIGNVKYRNPVQLYEYLTT